MNESEEEVAKRLYEACLSGSVETLNELLEKDQLILNRVGSTVCFSNDGTPLHVAVSCGHLELTKALLHRKKNLATELDSRRCTPLHLASTEGHLEIVRVLLRVNTYVCTKPDQDGRIPLHLAVMKERVEVIKELLEAKPSSVHVKLGRGETVLHLSIKHNRLEALKTVVSYLRNNDMESLLTDDDGMGNTILHLAAALKQVDTVKYLLGIESVQNHANVKNKNGSTALDVVEYCPNRDLKTMEIQELLLRSGVRESVRVGPEPHHESESSDPSQGCCKPGGFKSCICGFKRCICRFWKNYIGVDSDWLKEVRGHLITAATLTATMAYQSILSPPGGFWQETKKEGKNAASSAPSPSSSNIIEQIAPSPSSGNIIEQIAGHAIMDSEEGNYGDYLLLNTIVLGASLSTIMLAMTGFPTKNKFLTWLLVFTVYITISCMSFAYVIAVNLVSPNQISWTAVSAMTGSWFCLCTFVLALHSCRFLVWLGKKLVECFEACYGCCNPTRNERPPPKDPPTRV